MLGSRKSGRDQGFTLVEMMVGLSLLGVFMTGVFGAVRLSTLISESTIYESTAINVAQGYLEQIKSLPYDEVLLAAENPTAVTLSTVGPTLDANQDITVGAETITLDPALQPNERTIVMDIRGENNDVEIEFPLKMWVTVEDRNVGADPVNALEIKIAFEYQQPDVLGGTWISGQVQAIRARLE